MIDQRTALSRALSTLDVERFWERGYAILPKVYSDTEIAQLRRDVFASRGVGGDLLSNQRLRHVLLDGRMLAIARRLLGVESILYSGDSSFTINGTQCGWHKDNTDRVDPAAPDWRSRYTQLRFGIYCQDHVSHTGGLNVRAGSHLHCNLTDGETVYVQSSPGDLVVWSMRLTHSGNGMLLKDPSMPPPEPRDQPAIDPELVADADGDRVAIFAHLGADDSHGHRYADYLKTRTYMVNAWRKQQYDGTSRRAAASAGLTLRDMPAEVLGDPLAGASENWQPFPYDDQAAESAVRSTAQREAPLGNKHLKRGVRLARRAVDGVRDRLR